MGLGREEEELVGEYIALPDFTLYCTVDGYTLRRL